MKCFFPAPFRKSPSVPAKSSEPAAQPLTTGDQTRRHNGSGKPCSPADTSASGPTEQCSRNANQSAASSSPSGPAPAQKAAGGAAPVPAPRPLGGQRQLTSMSLRKGDDGQRSSSGRSEPSMRGSPGGSSAAASSALAGGRGAAASPASASVSARPPLHGMLRLSVAPEALTMGETIWLPSPNLQLRLEATLVCRCGRVGGGTRGEGSGGR